MSLREKRINCNAFRKRSKQKTNNFSAEEVFLLSIFI